MKRDRFLVLVAVMLLAMTVFCCAGCGPATPVDEQGNQVHQVTDSQGYKMTLPVKPKRIVSMTLGTDEILADLLPNTDRVVAMTIYSKDPSISFVTDKVKHVPHFIKGDNLEEIVALHPDLVLIADWWKTDAVQQLRDMGIPVYVYKTPYRVKEVPNEIHEIASVVGEEEKGKEIIQGYEQEVNDLYQSSHEKHKVPKLMLVVNGMGSFGGKGTLFNDMCTYANVDNGLSHIDLGQQPSTSQENIVQVNPQVILMPEWKGTNYVEGPSINELLKNPALQTVRAIQTHAVYPIEVKYLYCTSQYIVEGIKAIEKTTYQ